MMTPREVVARTVRFEKADRLPKDFPERWGSDFTGVGMDPSPDMRCRSGVDEWGAVWDCIADMHLGEVKDFPLKTWADYDSLNIPDIREEHRWGQLDGARDRAGDKFLMASGISIYERVHFIRGLENTWVDIHEEPTRLGKLIDVLVDMNLYAIERYAKVEADGYIFCDDWGLQSRLMIQPDHWRELWKPRYEKIFRAAHDAGMLTFMHSCGYLTDIMEDLIEIGLDVAQFDQQENMGLESLSQFRGRITFYSPVDIQYTMARGDLDEIREYARQMYAAFGTPDGGFIPKWYGDPVGAGHTQEAIEAQCEEFMLLSEEHTKLVTA
jgi:uroporphyrinogen decarboxylase